jgi:hypothetical protein
MGRLRARLATNPVEKDILKNLAEAERSLLKVLDIARSSRKDKNLRLGRLSEIEQKVQSAIRLIDNPPSITSKIDAQDPDLNPTVRDRKRMERMEKRGKK